MAKNTRQAAAESTRIARRLAAGIAAEVEQAFGDLSKLRDEIRLDLDSIVELFPAKDPREAIAVVQFGRGVLDHLTPSNLGWEDRILIANELISSLPMAVSSSEATIVDEPPLFDYPADVITDEQA